MPIFSDPQVDADLEEFRDPFTDVADWLSHSMRAENFTFNAKPRRTSDPPFDLDAALVNMNAGVELGSVYPGHHPVIPHMKSSGYIDQRDDLRDHRIHRC